MPQVLNCHPIGILHIGANIGEEADLYDAIPSIKNVVWYECNQAVLPYLHQNVDYRPGHFVMECAACDVDDKELDFHLTSNGASSSILPLGIHTQLYPNIKEVRVDKIRGWTVDTTMKLAGYKPEHFDFANIDVQGAELLVLKGMTKFLQKIRWVYSEVNFEELYKGCALAPEIDDFLASLGFKVVATADTGLKWADRLYERIS